MSGWQRSRRSSTGSTAATWGDTTSPGALNAKAATIGDGTGLTSAQLGTSEFIDYEPTPTLRAWDFTNWGTYFPVRRLASYVESLGLDSPSEFVNTLNNMAKHWQREQAKQACSELADFGRKAGQRSGRADGRAGDRPHGEGVAPRL